METHEIDTWKQLDPFRSGQRSTRNFLRRPSASASTSPSARDAGKRHGHSLRFQNALEPIR
jgi:hypothetical protein